MEWWEDGWYYREEEGEVWAAVVLMNETVSAILDIDRSNRYVASTIVRWKGEKLRVVSAYCRFSMEIGGMLSQIEMSIRAERGKRVLIAADVNARSPLWGADESDERGNEVEEMILSHELEVLNKSGGLKTFEDYSGRERNLDVTLVTKDVGRWKWSWKVVDVELSDHRMIEMEGRKTNERGMSMNEMRQGRWNWRSADWNKLNGMVRKEMMEVDWNGQEVNEGAEKMQSIVVKACEESVERVDGKVRKVRWWCGELSEMRKEIRRKRRKWVRQGGR